MYEIEMNLDAMHKTLEYSFHFFSCASSLFLLMNATGCHSFHTEIV